MTTRGQILRSSVTGNAPAAGTRAPGEMWTTFPDLQLGVIDASRNAQKLIAVRYFSTTANYAVGDMVVQGGAQYIANGLITAGAFSISQWTKIATTADLSGVYPIGDNRIINGDMRIDQRNNGASGTATNVYMVDRWSYTGTQASKIQWQRFSTGPANLGFPYCLGFSSLSAYSLLASDTFLLSQPIEADAISDFAWGTPQAQPVTLSFWVSCSLTGTFSGAVANYAGGAPTRSYPFTYSIPVADTSTRIVITIPGDTAGTWALSGNSGGAFVRFDLGSGATFRGPAGAWANGNFVGATGAVNLVSTNAAFLALTGVKLETGSVATPFNRQSLAKSMADCQRYYQKISGMMGYTSYSPGAFAFFNPFTIPVAMRATPTGVISNITNVSNCTNVAIILNSPSVFVLSATANGSGGANYNEDVSLSAEL